MFGISGIELMIILAVVLLIFGPEEMPRIGRIIGQGLRMFNEARQEVENVVTTEILRPEDAELLKDPLGMKSMGREFESTIRQISDPNYKPVPKGAGMRVSTDDRKVEQPSIEELEAQLEKARAQQGAPSPEEKAVTKPQVAREVDRDDAASIWGVAPKEGPTDEADVTEVTDGASVTDAVEAADVAEPTDAGDVHGSEGVDAN